MAEWLALAEVAARPLAGRGFSVHPQGGLDHAGFRVQAAGWRAAFAGQPGHRVAMYFEDAATFAAALFGAWHAGKTPVLCMDALPRTCDELGATVDAFAGDFPDAFSPLAMQAVDDDGGQWPALDEAAYEKLAAFRLAGGAIQNIALTAVALPESGSDPMRPLLRAIVREYQKLGRPVRRGEFGRDDFKWIVDEQLL